MWCCYFQLTLDGDVPRTLYQGFQRQQKFDAVNCLANVINDMDQENVVSISGNI